MAAVNDITAREEQFQSFLTQNKTENSLKNDSIHVNYYSNTQIPQVESHITTKTKIDNNSLHEPGPRASFAHDPSTNEFVDYSEVKLIEKKGESSQECVRFPVVKRKLRKKTTKKRDDECKCWICVIY